MGRWHGRRPRPRPGGRARPGRGHVPRPVHDDSLLPDHERAATGDELAAARRRRRAPAPPAARHPGRRQPAPAVVSPGATCAAASNGCPSRWVTWRSPAPSPASVPVADELLGAEHALARPRGLVRRRPARLAFPANEQEYRLRALLASQTEPALLGRPACSAARPCRGGGPAQRRLHPLRRQPRRVRRPVPRRPRHLGHPARALGRLPVRLLHARRARRRGGGEPRGPTAASRPLDRGTWSTRPSRRSSPRCSPDLRLSSPVRDEPGRRPTDHRMAEIADEVCARYEAGLTGAPIFWQRDRRRIVAELDRFLDDDSDQRARRRHAARWPPSSPSASPGGTGPRRRGPARRPHRPLPGQGRPRRRGRRRRRSTSSTTRRASRRTTGASPKTTPTRGGSGSSSPCTAWRPRQLHGTPDTAGDAEYWFISNGASSRGSATRSPPKCSTVSARRSAHRRRHRGGRLPAPSHRHEHGTPFVECPYCDPDGLGVTELRRAWTASVPTPALAPFFELVDPDDRAPTPGAAADA